MTSGVRRSKEISRCSLSKSCYADCTQFLVIAIARILIPSRELSRNQPATRRKNHDAPRRYAVPTVCLVPVCPGPDRHAGQALRPGTHVVRRCGAVALPRGLAADGIWLNLRRRSRTGPGAESGPVKGGEFPHRFTAEKRTTFRNGHTVARGRHTQPPLPLECRG